MPVGDPTLTKYGPGRLFIASTGTAEPTDLTSAWDPAWVVLGYTKNGSTFEYNPTFNKIEVEEELDPINWASTSREIHVKFELAAVTAGRLSVALNGGSIVIGGTVVTFTPPALGQEISHAIGWESNVDPTLGHPYQRSVFRKCKQTGSVAVAHQKAPNYATLPCDFILQAVAGDTPFIDLYDPTLA